MMFFCSFLDDDFNFTKKEKLEKTYTRRSTPYRVAMVLINYTNLHRTEE
jgi:hypothetical protein